MNRTHQGALLLAVALPLTAAESPRGLRDPMQPPVTVRAPAALANSTVEAASPQNLSARHLLVVEGRRYVMDGNRRRGVGDLLGDARIERIEDAAVVVRNAAGTQRLPLFGGVVKQAVPDATSQPRSDRTSSPGAQP